MFSCSLTVPNFELCLVPGTRSKTIFFSKINHRHLTLQVQYRANSLQRGSAHGPGARHAAMAPRLIRIEAFIPLSHSKVCETYLRRHLLFSCCLFFYASCARVFQFSARRHFRYAMNVICSFIIIARRQKPKPRTAARVFHFHFIYFCLPRHQLVVVYDMRTR